jgi:hypothetical protein
MNDNKNEPAYPTESYYGLSKRELFAAMAMQGFISNSNAMGTYEDFARDSVEIAEALIKELEK